MGEFQPGIWLELGIIFQNNEKVYLHVVETSFYSVSFQNIFFYVQIKWKRKKRVNAEEEKKKR